MKRPISGAKRERNRQHQQRSLTAERKRNHFVFKVYFYFFGVTVKRLFKLFTVQGRGEAQRRRRSDPSSSRKTSRGRPGDVANGHGSGKRQELSQTVIKGEKRAFEDDISSFLVLLGKTRCSRITSPYSGRKKQSDISKKIPEKFPRTTTVLNLRQSK